MAFAGLAPSRGGQAVALAWKGLRPDAGCSIRSRAGRDGGLSAAAAAVGTLCCCQRRTGHKSGVHNTCPRARACRTSAPTLQSTTSTRPDPLPPPSRRALNRIEQAAPGRSPFQASATACSPRAGASSAKAANSSSHFRGISQPVRHANVCPTYNRAV